MVEYEQQRGRSEEPASGQDPEVEEALSDASHDTVKTPSEDDPTATETAATDPNPDA